MWEGSEGGMGGVEGGEIIILMNKIKLLNVKDIYFPVVSALVLFVSSGVL